jgi:4-hydroxybenzoate polyprenyltransferase
MGDSVVRGARLRIYANFVKFEHTVFSVPLVFAGAVLAAGGWPTWWQTGWTVIAAASARTIGMGLNRIIDRRIDARNPRTQDRALPAGHMTVGEAWCVVIVAGACYVLAAASLNTLCLIASPIPIVLFAVYPFLKRVTPLAHLGLGVTWCLAPVAGWMAVAGSIGGAQSAWTLALFCLLWVTGFDIIYATLDAEVDRAQHVHSLPATLGKDRALDIALVLHVSAFIVLVYLYGMALRGSVSFILLLLAALLLLIEHVKHDDVPVAFFRVNAILGCVVFGIVVAGVLG